eukprot:CAMPEP_0172184662 /NCGR_PEP_ID=MMETSP1050-20130122/19707_1 /TAXON_ID=233186 /ORGANISM="Cryptomonas curvata, Strain CCAP979/52" /LENGTH=285 /DNA_ID=CAMNT_0012858499 /DNA_START=208 /DNA_END=1062 /DNA_ORIENTATION=-
MTNTKTEDNVSVQIRTVVQFAVDPTKVEDFFFKVTNVNRQLEAHVDSIVRSEIPKYNLDAAFKVKDNLAASIKEELSKQMAPYGLVIISCLMADLTPDASVLAAMNAINAARRERDVNFEKAEAEKLLTVTQARAAAEAQHIAGEGMAKQRRAVAAGFCESVQELSSRLGLDHREAVHATLVAQYLDVLREFAVHGRASVMVPHGPGALSSIETQVRDGFVQANALSAPPPPPPLAQGGSTSSRNAPAAPRLPSPLAAAAPRVNHPAAASAAAEGQCHRALLVTR